MKLLFICNLGMHRSRTAAEIFVGKHETRYKGVYSNLVSKEDLDWADVVYVMQEHQRSEIGKKFPKQYLQNKIINLAISDIYSYNSPGLIKKLKKKLVL